MLYPLSPIKRLLFIRFILVPYWGAMLSALQHLSYMKRRSFYELYESSVAVHRPQEGKSILLFVILLVMATFVLTALALGNASKAAQQELRQKALAGVFSLALTTRKTIPI